VFVATRRTRGTRAKDSDRVSTCQVLDSALAQGQLSMAEHAQRVSAATNATTLGDLQALVTDLQTAKLAPAAPVRRPWQSPRGRAVIAGVIGVVLVLCVAVGWSVWSDSGASTNTTSKPSTAATETHVMAAEPAPPTEKPDEVPAVVLPRPGQLLSAEGMAGVLDAMRKRFGDTMGYELAITPDEAMLGRPDPADDHSKLIYSYHGGWGDPSSRSKSDTDDLTDLSAFDVQAAAAAVKAAPETLKIAPADVSGTFLDIDNVADPPGPGAIELLVKISTNSGKDGFIYLDGASNIKRVEAPS
jgi:hypothetical protein